MRSCVTFCGSRDDCRSALGTIVRLDASFGLRCYHGLPLLDVIVPCIKVKQVGDSAIVCAILDDGLRIREVNGDYSSAELPES